mmetsp:Transcript_9423/g.25428  ORF Transcript_9423/g.25428 Transcript_9423/m.25428 type:complete len:219 (-) Transcript_9423:707-1363(-)
MGCRSWAASRSSRAMWSREALLPGMPWIPSTRTQMTPAGTAAVGAPFAVAVAAELMLKSTMQSPPSTVSSSSPGAARSMAHKVRGLTAEPSRSFRRPGSDSGAGRVPSESSQQPADAPTAPKVSTARWGHRARASHARGSWRTVPCSSSTVSFVDCNEATISFSARRTEGRQCRAPVGTSAQRWCAGTLASSLKVCRWSSLATAPAADQDSGCCSHSA